MRRLWVKTLPLEEHLFGYRDSVFRHRRFIHLSSVFALQAGDKAQIRAYMNELMQRRRDKQPLEYPSAGSVFKRYPGRYTAQMIDEAGLRGLSVGGAQVSEKHRHHEPDPDGVEEPAGYRSRPYL